MAMGGLGPSPDRPARARTVRATPIIASLSKIRSQVEQRDQRPSHVRARPSKSQGQVMSGQVLHRLDWVRVRCTLWQYQSRLVWSNLDQLTSALAKSSWGLKGYYHLLWKLICNRACFGHSKSTFRLLKFALHPICVWSFAASIFISWKWYQTYVFRICVGTKLQSVRFLAFVRFLWKT